MKLIAIVFGVCMLCLADSAQEALHRAETFIDRERFAEAEQILAASLQANQDSVEVLYRLGYVRYRQRKLAAARACFAKVIKLSPSAYYSMYFLGQISLMENRPAEAISWFRPIVERSEPVFDAASRLAAAYAQAGDNEKAEQTIRIAIAQSPWDAALYFRLGQLQKKRGQPELAQESFANSNRLQQASRRDVQTLMQVGKDLHEGRSSEGLRAGEAILQRTDVDPGTVVALGVLYGGADQHERALQAFELAAQRDPRFFAAQLNTGLARLRTNRAQEASAALETATELLPQSLEANLALGLSYIVQQRYVDAVKPLEQAWRLDNKNTRAGALLATAYLRTSTPAKAVAVLVSPVFRTSIDPAFTLLLVDAQTAGQDLQGALETARAGRRRFPNVPDVQLAEAQVLIRLGQYQQAQAVFRHALTLKPDWAEAHVGLADCLQKAGEHASAIEHYEAAKGFQTTALAARLGLGRSFLALRQLDRAQSVLEEAVSAYPADVAVHVELSRVYARLGRNDLAADQTRAAEKLRSGQAK